jgi:hypothetical protein
LVGVLPIALGGLAVSLGLNYRYASASVLVIFLWVWYAHQQGPSPAEDPVYGFLRGIRTRLYFGGLLFYVLTIWMITVAFPPTEAAIALVVFFVIYPLRAATLNGILVAIFRADKRLIDPRNKAEQEAFDEMWKRVGGSTIYLAYSLFYTGLALEVAPTVGLATVVLALIWVGVTVSFTGRRAVIREWESREYARQLAESLRKRHWDRRFGKASSPSKPPR